MFTLYKNAKSICVAICFGFPHSLTGLLYTRSHPVDNVSACARCSCKNGDFSGFKKCPEILDFDSFGAILIPLVQSL